MSSASRAITCSQLYKLIEESPIRLVGMTREDNAGFAADAYARIHGLGCICVTYCVGGLCDLQQHRRGLRREVAGDRAGRLAGAVGAGAQPALAPQGQGIRDAVRGLSEDHGRLGRAGQARDGLQRDRPGAGSGRAVQAAGLSRAAARPGHCAPGQAAPAAGGAAAQRPRCPARGARRGGRAAHGGRAGR